MSVKDLKELIGNPNCDDELSPFPENFGKLLNDISVSAATASQNKKFSNWKPKAFVTASGLRFSLINTPDD